MTRPFVEVFADIVCPFAHVGLRRFVAFRDAADFSLPALRVRAWPLELVNGKRLETAVNAEHIDDLRGGVAPDLFGGFDRAVPATSSLPALALVATAYTVSDATGERLSLAVRDAFFEDGLDISDAAVLDRIATAAGLDGRRPDSDVAVLDDYEEGRRRGVRGSPEFFVDGRGWYCPSLHIEKVDDHLDIEPDEETIDAFLTECFA